MQRLVDVNRWRKICRSQLLYLICSQKLTPVQLQIGFSFSPLAGYRKCLLPSSLMNIIRVTSLHFEVAHSVWCNIVACHKQVGCSCVNLCECHSAPINFHILLTHRVIAADVCSERSVLFKMSKREQNWWNKVIITNLRIEFLNSSCSLGNSARYIAWVITVARQWHRSTCALLKQRAMIDI